MIRVIVSVACLEMILPEIIDFEIYWIHSDHLGSSSVLINSRPKITNWYEYMPFGESLMELSNRQYDNPYKYNGKELDSQTGLYYYGARYYDPQRSFWLSVDPLVEITMSPYTYTWNDPINYTDPTGMIGERIGDSGGPNFFKKLYDWIFGDKPKKSSLTLGTITSSREPDLPWYLNEGDYEGKPVLILGAHNIKFPYLQRDEYGDTFIKNSLGAVYNGLASIWNDGMAGKKVLP